MPKTPTDPIRARLYDLIEELEQHLQGVRDFASIPGNSWLAKGELQNMSTKLSDLEALLEEVKDSDSESGY